MPTKRVTKKLLKICVELDELNLERVYLGGEFSVLADAPSRAPQDREVARNLPVPLEPIKSVAHRMFWDPGAPGGSTRDRVQALKIENPGVLTYLPDEIQRDETPPTFESDPVLPRQRSMQAPAVEAAPEVVAALAESETPRSELDQQRAAARLPPPSLVAELPQVVQDRVLRAVERIAWPTQARAAFRDQGVGGNQALRCDSGVDLDELQAEVAREINEALRPWIPPDFRWTSTYVNKNTVAKGHVDKGILSSTTSSRWDWGATAGATTGPRASPTSAFGASCGACTANGSTARDRFRPSRAPHDGPSCSTVTSLCVRPP